MAGPVSLVIDEAWALLDPAPRPMPLPSRPCLVVLVGVPLSGKSTLARALAREATTALTLVENDALRARLAQGFGRAAPAYDAEENFLVHRVSTVLLERALRAGAGVLLDATNLHGSDRRRWRAGPPTRTRAGRRRTASSAAAGPSRPRTCRTSCSTARGPRRRTLPGCARGRRSRRCSRADAAETRRGRAPAHR